MLKLEALGYPNGEIYTMIRLTKEGSPVFSEMIPLPKMEYGCHFFDVMVNDKTLVLYGGVCDPDYQYVATAAAINLSAEVLWLKDYSNFSGFAAAVSLCDRSLFSLTSPDRLGNTLIVIDEFGNTADTFFIPLNIF